MMAARDALLVSEFSFFSSPGAAVLLFLRKEKEKNGGAKRADSTRKGHAASVTLLRREQLRKVVRPYKAFQMEF